MAPVVHICWGGIDLLGGRVLVSNASAHVELLRAQPHLGNERQLASRKHVELGIGHHLKNAWLLVVVVAVVVVIVVSKGARLYEERQDSTSQPESGGLPHSQLQTQPPAR